MSCVLALQENLCECWCFMKTSGNASAGSIFGRLCPNICCYGYYEGLYSFLTAAALFWEGHLSWLGYSCLRKISVHAYAGDVLRRLPMLLMVF